MIDYIKLTSVERYFCIKDFEVAGDVKHDGLKLCKDNCFKLRNDFINIKENIYVALYNYPINSDFKSFKTKEKSLPELYARYEDELEQKDLLSYFIPLCITVEKIISKSGNIVKNCLLCNSNDYEGESRFVGKSSRVSGGVTIIGEKEIEKINIKESMVSLKIKPVFFKDVKIKMLPKDYKSVKYLMDMTELDNMKLAFTNAPITVLAMYYDIDYRQEVFVCINLNVPKEFRRIFKVTSEMVQKVNKIFVFDRCLEDVRDYIYGYKEQGIKKRFDTLDDILSTLNKLNEELK